MQIELKSKKELRELVKANLKSKNSAWFEDCSYLVSKNLISYLSSIDISKGVIVYCPISGEVDISPVTLFLQKNKIAIAFPKIESFELKQMSFYWVDEKDSFVKNIWGIFEPPLNAKKFLLEESVSAIVVPALAFDIKGNRLGRGKGFYDRALSGICRRFDKFGKNVILVGVCFEEQLFEEIPHNKFDIPVNYIITEKNIKRCL